MLRWGLGLRCFLIIMTRSTRTRSLSAMTRMTLPRLPLSLPAITSTVSLRLILMPAIKLSSWHSALAVCCKQILVTCYCPAGSQALKLDNLRGERDDLEKLLLAKFAGHGSEDAGSDRLVGVIDDYSGVLVKTDIGSVPAARLLTGANDHCLYYFT